MKVRHKAREVALQILYRYDPGSLKAPPAPSPIVAVPGSVFHGAIPTGSKLTDDLAYHFSHFQVPEQVREFAALLVIGTLSKIKEIDTELEQKATNWKLERMSVIDRNLLRMAAYEIQNVSDSDKAMVIDEAIELAKQYSSSDSTSFINGVLDKFTVLATLPKT